MCANEIKIAGTEKEDKTTTVKCKLTHTVEDGVYAFSIAKKYNMTPEELKQCNKDNKKVLPNGVNGDFVLHVGDVLNVKGKVISTRVVDGNKQPTVNSSSCAPWMDVAWKEYKTFIDKRAGSGKYVIDPKLNARAKEYHDYVYGEKNKHTGQTRAWCASFVSWNLKQANILDNPKTASSQAFANHQSLKKIDKPAYGAIAVFRDFVYVGNSASEDFSVDYPMVSLKNGIIEYVQTNDFVTSIKKDGQIIFKANGSGHVNFVVSLVKGKEKSLVNCLGGNQDGGCISKKTYIYGKSQLFIAYGNTYRMSMGFFIPKFSKECPDKLLISDKSYGFSTTDR